MKNLKITLDDVSKRYDRYWVFKNLTQEFSTGMSYAITGKNGSGKSTLLRLLSAMESPTTGKRSYSIDGNPLEEGQIFRHLSFTAPYMGLPAHLTVREVLSFHACFKSLQYSSPELLLRIDFVKLKDKRLEHLSTGQIQKIRLAMALFSTDELLFLDEPSSNLDDENMDWFTRELKSHMDDRMICIATNDQRDVNLCDEIVSLERAE